MQTGTCLHQAPSSDVPEISDAGKANAASLGEGAPVHLQMKLPPWWKGPAPEMCP